jgi:general secretion pathway protein N
MNAIATTSEATSPRFPWRWLAVGVIAYLLFLLATFPAARLTAKLQTKGVVAAGVSGSIWHGTAAALQINGIALGATEWNIHPWRLVLGTLSVDIHAKRDDGYADATVLTGFKGATTIRDLRGSLPVNALSTLGLPGGGAYGWGGTIQVKLDELVLTNNWPTAIKGSVDIANLFGPAQQPTQLGGYRIVFAAPSATASEVQGNVTSMDDALLDVAGTLRLSPNRTYVIDAQVGTRANAPASFVKTLQYLGLPDAQGRRPLSIAGSL